MIIAGQGTIAVELLEQQADLVSNSVSLPRNGTD
jgi:threonine dehydratase